ncbi:protein translocase subunit SecD [Flavimobilis rhizosphaerae]|uniref:protein translocase subunit SecD n=1 Tax=Flavimobilis rhizosphaerae TaxID=2775421 RepID=UPI002E2D1273|nr:protein translocase subunit SecD [Flavimobilis rhizosphaerae]
MASSTKKTRPLRTLISLAILIALAVGGLAAGVKWGDADWTPNLALDLEGGTQIILTPVATDGSAITEEDLRQAINVIRQRVDASGVAEAEISSQGGQNIVVALPGTPDQATLDLVRRSAQMNFRPVLVQDYGFAAEPTPTPSATDESTDKATDEPTDKATDESTDEATDESTDEATDGATTGSTGGESKESTDSATATASATSTATDNATDEPTSTPTTQPKTEASNPSDLAQITDTVKKEFDALVCDDSKLTGGDSGDPDAVLVTCSDDGLYKYILGPVEIPGTQIKNAQSGLRVVNNATTNESVVNIEFSNEGKEAFYQTTKRLAEQYAQGSAGADVAPNLFAMVLDGLVISAPQVTQAIPDGRAEISGSFTRQSAATLANQLNFGSLPLDFKVQSEMEISATLGSEQLQKGLLAGLIGLILVVLYSLVQYRVLGFVTVASLVMATIITYIVITYLSWLQGYRLSLAGVTGLIVAIGITADSFIVYFERIRDELRDGRALVGSVEKGWDRARRTILASDAVNLLAAIVLFFLAVGGVRGFAYTLGLTTVIDVIVVFFFTHPLMELLARTRFFGGGHPASGLDPRQLGGRAAVYQGRGRVRAPQATVRKKESDGVTLGGFAGSSATDVEDRPLTIAERRALALREEKPSQPEPTTATDEAPDTQDDVPEAATTEVAGEDEEKH